MNQRDDHIQLMDRIYRFQRYFYDATRKYYLLGRDALIREMDFPEGGRVLEMGCGTGRNLVKLARRRPDARLYGIDASGEMLKTAEKTLRAKGLDNQIVLRQCLAEEVDYRATFGLDEPFDAVFFSYALSMIPTWRESMRCALDNVKPGGGVHVVDFWDQGDLPAWFRKLLTRWLALFHVQHRPELLEYIQSLEGRTSAGARIDSIMRRYAFKTHMRKA